MDEERVRQIAREEADRVLSTTIDGVSKAFIKAGESYSLFFKQFGEQIEQLTTIATKLETSFERLEKDIRPVVEAFNEEQNTKRLLSKKFSSVGAVTEVVLKIAGVLGILWAIIKYVIWEAITK